MSERIKHVHLSYFSFVFIFQKEEIRNKYCVYTGEDADAKNLL